MDKSDLPAIGSSFRYEHSTYTLGQIIGEGGYGLVFKATITTMYVFSLN